MALHKICAAWHILMAPPYHAAHSYMPCSPVLHGIRCAWHKIEGNVLHGICAWHMIIVMHGIKCAAWHIRCTHSTPRWHIICLHGIRRLNPDNLWAWDGYAMQHIYMPCARKYMSCDHVLHGICGAMQTNICHVVMCCMTYVDNICHATCAA